MPRKKLIEWMNRPEWIWVEKGEAIWINAQGKQSDAKHAHNILSNEDISLRQAQNQQRQNKAVAGIIKPSTVHREHNVKTRVYQQQIHGTTVVHYERTLENLRIWVQTIWSPASADPLRDMNIGIVILHFTSSKIEGKVYRRAYKNKNGRTYYRIENYATLTKRVTINEFRETDDWWYIAEAKADEFNWDEDESPAPFQFFAQER